MKRSAAVGAAICGLWIGAALAADKVPLGIMNATQVFDPTSNQPVIRIALDANGRAGMAAVSAKNVGRVVDLYVDDTVVASPMIREPVLGGFAQISGSFSVEEATELAVRLRNGSSTLAIAARD